MESTAKIAIKKIKDLSRTIKFNSTKYNKLGVETKTPINDQILLVNHKLLSFMETEVIANTFNRSVLISLQILSSLRDLMIPLL